MQIKAEKVKPFLIYQGVFFLSTPFLAKSYSFAPGIARGYLWYTQSKPPVKLVVCTGPIRAAYWLAPERGIEV